jgi:Mg-chelatase subunit ChlD
VYLPVLQRGHCAAEGTADVVFLVDTSYGMMHRGHDGTVMLELVQMAATDLAWALEASGHRAAVVTFADRARVRQGLTDERVKVEIALSRVYADVGAGSRLDLGLAAARDLLLGPDADRQHLPVVVLVTDGFDAGGAAAEGVRDHGGMVFAVGMGPSVSIADLLPVAGGASRAWLVGDGAGLGDTYASIGQAIDCAVRSAR